MLFNRNSDNVDPQKFSTLMRENHILIDVRTYAEFEENHMLNAISIPLNDIASFTNSIKIQNQSKLILVYCTSGARSATALNILYSAGCRNMYNLAGGISAWNNMF